MQRPQKQLVRGTFDEVPRIPANDIVKGQIISENKFRVIYKGSCKGNQVAVKEFKRIDSILPELQIMVRAHHPHVVMLLGACIEENSCSLVYEFCTKRDLARLLRDKTLSISKKLQCAIHVCNGMAWLTHLDGVRILHGDLTTSNIFVMDDWTCKIADFGLSLLNSNHISGGPKLEGDPKSSSQHAEKNDIYSFGLVLWEIITQIRPFEHSHAIANGKQLTSYPQIDSVIRKCCSQNPSQRPSFPNLVSILQKTRIDIFLPLSLCPDASTFWSKKWSAQERVPSQQFVHELFSFLARGAECWRTKLFEQKCVQAIFASSYMSLVKFGKLLKWFGPLKSGMVVNILESIKKNWFFGAIDSLTAQTRLRPFISNNGTFLVRLNLKATEPYNFAPFIISTVDNGVILHKRVYRSRDGQGYYLRWKKNMRLKSSGEIDNLIDLIQSTSASPWKIVCPGHPFYSLIN